MLQFYLLVFSGQDIDEENKNISQGATHIHDILHLQYCNLWKYQECQLGFALGWPQPGLNLESK